MKLRRPFAMAAVLVSMATACSSSDDQRGVENGTEVDAAVETAVTEATDTGGPDTAVFTETDDLGPVPPQPPGDVAVSDSVLEPIEPVSETGVPGIDSDDEFCRSWSEFAGSYQALTFGWAIQGGEAAARLEVVATDVLSRAVAAMGEHLPAAIESDRQALTVDLPTPLLRRAERARALLADAGVDEPTIVALGDMWLAAVTEAGLESETLAVTIDDPALDEMVDEAARALLEQLPPIIEDPSLIVDVDISATENHLFENCPDRGVLSGNDRIDQ
ncbi:hypothetical protein [Ilumatobacter coccineus]|uniref:Uncharacterized protein n=1 Tax=Ilumatobacter coccineus (strain NBRC 103263 / KCTC 29153 / YM16-304) TaxID=1313172 RepID=A0A6C7EBH6_ILUCY|nr:hypothetical protein [Ilumatobacter coccineus]BAN01366.1 hypothetical protein YM304_10520 [Ilumatobacter coccineus YM16-304]